MIEANKEKIMVKKAAVKKSAKKSPSKNKAVPKKKSAKKSTLKKWSKKVTQTSNAMDLEKDIFKQKNPKAIAESVKRSAEKSKRKKAGAFQSAMSMINFYENRAGKNLEAGQKKILDKSKDELRKLYGREKEE